MDYRGSLMALATASSTNVLLEAQNEARLRANTGHLARQFERSSRDGHVSLWAVFAAEQVWSRRAATSSLRSRVPSRADDFASVAAGGRRRRGSVERAVRDYRPSEVRGVSRAADLSARTRNVTPPAVR